MPSKKTRRLTQRKGKNVKGNSTKEKPSTNRPTITQDSNPNGSKKQRIDHVTSPECSSVNKSRSVSIASSIDTSQLSATVSNTQIAVDTFETKPSKQPVAMTVTPRKKIIILLNVPLKSELQGGQLVPSQIQTEEISMLEMRTSNISLSHESPVTTACPFPNVEIVYPQLYSDSSDDEETNPLFKRPRRKSADIVKEQRSGLMNRQNKNVVRSSNNRRSSHHDEIQEILEIHQISKEAFPKNKKIHEKANNTETPINGCCCFVAGPASRRCPIHETQNEIFDVEEEIVFDPQRETDIFTTHINSPSNVFDFEHEIDDYVQTETAPVPVENDHDRRNRLDAARNSDLLDLEARKAEIERVRNRIAQLRTYLQAADSQAQAHHCGPMNQRCRHCGAKFFRLEYTTTAKYTKCCNNNKINLNNLQPFPLELKQLFKGEHELSREFKSKILIYNNLFQFASVQANLRDIPGQGPYVYAIQGQLHHHYSDINVQRDSHQFGPVYFLDPEQAARERANNGERFNIDRQLIRLIGDILQRNNPFAQQYRSLYRVYERQTVEMAERNIQIPRVYLEFVAAHRQRREYANPQIEEVAAVVQYNEERPPNPRMRVFLTNQDNGLRTIDNESEYIDPLTFPLLFPCGDLGWNLRMPLNIQRQEGRQRITVLQYYSYRLAIRIDDDDEEQFDIFRFSGRLLQKFVVSAFLKIEANRINYFRSNQNQLRIDEYEGLADYVHHRGQNENVPIGRMLILPSSFQGGPRSQLQRFQDAMAVVMKMGHPSLFITMTCNPNWPEIRENVPHGDEPSNHPLLISRVFQMKLNQLIEDLTKGHVMGVCIAYIYVIEFQKRGLPHAHILITLRNEDKLQDDIRIDDLISAELPDPQIHEELFALVSKHMIHGPCGRHNPASVCMQNDQCSKHFPKFWYHQTTIRDGKINYRRRNDGRQAEIRRGNRVYVVDNSFVVPYNPFLLLKYRTHINVEAIAGTMSIKYVYKYFFKGPDQALLRIVGEGDDQQIQYDEITSYLNARYITPPESAWRILQFHMHGNSHHVERLQIHLPNRQGVIFQPGRERIAANAEHRTQLTEWFETNRNDPFARQFSYVEFPQHFVWNKNTKRWTRRRRTTAPVVSRLHTVSIRCGELYYLRLLLLHVKGCTSFEDLKTVNEIVSDSFQDACRQRNLLLEDQEWVRSLTEAGAKEMPRQLRQMFAYILLYGTVDDPPALWRQFRNSLIEDFVRRRGLNEEDAETAALQKIQSILMVSGRRLSDFGLADPPEYHSQINDEPTNIMEERRQAENMVDQLNADQRIVFDRIMAAIEDDQQPRRLFFVTGTAGTGKTFLYNCLVTQMNAREFQVISIAWTGLAASLLKQVMQLLP